MITSTPPIILTLEQTQGAVFVSVPKPWLTVRQYVPVATYVGAVTTYVGAVALSQLSQPMWELSHCRSCRNLCGSFRTYVGAVAAVATYVGAVTLMWELSHCRSCRSCHWEFRGLLP